MTDIIISVIIAALIIVGVIYTRKHFQRKSGCCGGGTSYVSKKKLKKIVSKKIITVQGMTCEKCKARVERFLNDSPGLVGKADLKQKQVTVSMETLYTDEQLTEIIENAGFKVVDVKSL